MPNRFFRIVFCSLLAGCSAASNADSASPRSAGNREASADHSSSQAPLPSLSAGASAVPSAAAPTSGASTPQVSGTSSARAGAGGAAAPSSQPVTPRSEKYEPVGTNPFVYVAHDPFSTFAADVDTASYDIFRRNVEHHVATSAASVRVEDFVNYFEYDYAAPAQDAEHPFQLNLAMTENPLGRDTVFLRVGIQAQNPPAAAKKPANLVFLVDVSGSMLSEDKLPLVQYLLTQTLEVLDSDDTVSIVTYAGSTEVRLAPTSVADKAKIGAVVNGLQAGGGTNGGRGIQLAYEQAERAFLQDGINHVIMCTDGDFNVGISSTDALVKLIEEKRTSGITLTALGFGIGNLNDAMMEKVSNAGNGIYSVITSRTQASRYAETRMLSTFIHVAKDMKIQLEWNPSHVLAYRLIGYENRAIADNDFRNDIIDAGEVGAGHRVTALYEVVPKDKQLPKVQGAPAAQDGEATAGDREVGAKDLVVVKVRYKQPGAGETDPAREVVSKVAASEQPSTFEEADRNLRWTVAIAAFAENLKQSPYAVPGSRELLREVFVEQQERDSERQELLQLFDQSL